MIKLFLLLHYLQGINFVSQLFQNYQQIKKWDENEG